MITFVSAFLAAFAFIGTLALVGLGVWIVFVIVMAALAPLFNRPFGED